MRLGLPRIVAEKCKGVGAGGGSEAAAGIAKVRSSRKPLHQARQ